MNLSSPLGSRIDVCGPGNAIVGPAARGRLRPTANYNPAAL